MKSVVLGGIAAGLSFASASVASPVLHLDVNGVTTQARNTAGAAAPFTGINHSGSITFGFQAGVSALVAMESQPFIGGPATNLGFTGSLTNFTGTINLTNGTVTGGSMRADVNSGDFYQTSITPGSGTVQTFAGGGFTIQGLTFNGQFQDATFGNVNISQWFGFPANGSFLQFNFNPNANGASNADVDIFVQAIPLPPAALSGMATLTGLGLLGAARRRAR
jgi:hypothetical protein